MCVVGKCFFCKTLDVDPGVSGTVVGFPVQLWSCVLLVLRLAVSVPLIVVALRRVVSVCVLCLRCSVELFFCLSGCAWGFCFSFVFCLVINVCVPQRGRSAACTSPSSLVSASPVCRSCLFLLLFL